MYCLTLLLFIPYISSNLPTVIPSSSFVFMTLTVYCICICLFHVALLLMLLLQMQYKSSLSSLLPAQVMAIITLHTFFMVSAVYKYKQSESLRSTIRCSNIFSNNMLQIRFVLEKFIACFIFCYSLPFTIIFSVTTFHFPHHSLCIRYTCKIPYINEINYVWLQLHLNKFATLLLYW